MSDGQGTEDPERADDETAAARRRRLADVFGDALPERARDERPDAWGDRTNADSDDERLRREVPPHHG